MFIDVHTHITWGIDDGIQTLEACEAAFQQAKADGIERVIATPHFVPGVHNPLTVASMKKRMAEVWEIAKKYQVNYYFGSELFLNREFLDMIEENLFLPLADSRYLLCEFDVHDNPEASSSVEDRLYELCIRNYIPIIAHAERYFHKGMNLNRVQRWMDMGCKIQINRTSIVGLHGKRMKRNAALLLKNGMVHLVATDAHSISGSRIPKLSDAYEVIKKKCGEETAQILTYDNPLHMIEHEELEGMKERGKKKQFLFRKG